MVDSDQGWFVVVITVARVRRAQVGVPHARRCRTQHGWTQKFRDLIVDSESTLAISAMSVHICLLCGRSDGGERMVLQ